MEARKGRPYQEVVGSPRRELSARLQPLCPVVTVHVFHRSFDDLAPIGGGVDEVPVSRVDPHVGYGLPLPSLLEEDYVAGAKARLCDLAAAVVVPLAIFAHGQLVPELAEDRLGQARAAHRLVGAGGVFVLGTDVSPRHPDDVGRRGPAGPAFLPRGVLPLLARGVLLLLARGGHPLARGVLLLARGGHPLARGVLLVRGLLRTYLGAPDDHHGVRDHATPAYRARGDFDGIGIAVLHLVRAEPHPHAAIRLLVHLGPLDPGGGADAEAGCGTVFLRGRPPCVNGVVIGCGDLHLEPGGCRGSRRLDVAVVLAVIQRTLGVPLPPRRAESSWRSVVDDLRVVRSRLHRRKRLRRRMSLGDAALRYRIVLIVAFRLPRNEPREQ